MITDAVIKEIYKSYGKHRMKDVESKIDYFIELLSPVHTIHHDDMEVVIDSLEETNFFRRFLKRSIMAIIEFDKEVAFVFKSHIIFLHRNDSDIDVHIRLEEKKSFLQRLFGH